jgi:2-methylisocitrate lyase-like PEP mutase family enzyme
MAQSAGQAQLLRRLHLDPEILVLVNVWDVASARTIAALPACRAIATASWSIAASLGMPDHEQLTRADMLAAVGRIAAGVDLPVTADLESGYGANPAEVGETIARAIGAGIAGCNLEDRNRPLTEAAARIEAVRNTAGAEGVPIVLNARVDMPVATPEQLDEAVTRARAYLDAGADCVFPIRIRDAAVLEQFVARVAAPVNAFGYPNGPSVAQLAAIGVARVSFGPGPYGAALLELRRTGETLLAGGEVDPAMAFRPPTDNG